MRSQPAARLAWQRASLTGSSQAIRPRGIQIYASASRQSSALTRTQHVSRLSTQARPTVPFLTARTPERTYASDRQQALKTYLRHQGKLLVRYAILSWGGALCLFVIYFFYVDETLEREYPTPHEWSWRERKFLRDAHKYLNPEYGSISWSKSYQMARNLVVRLEDAQRGSGGGAPRLHDHEDPNDPYPGEFIPHDISGKSEEWRRGYFEAMMMAARGSGVVDGWLKEKDSSKTHVWPPQFVIGPSNPRPKPIPPKSPPAPREEDCEIAFPPADRYYLKIMATRGFDRRQKMEAALEYANFIDTKRHHAGSDALYNLALAEATQGTDQTKLPYDPKTFVLRDGIPPSQNVLTALGALANHKARSGDTSAALPIYLSLLKARRSLSPVPPPVSAASSRTRTSDRSFTNSILRFFSQPDYPPPPPDGTAPPWRSPEERCIEASLAIYIGEILYATSSREDGVAWTREGVDVAEEQLRFLTTPDASRPAPSATGAERCRECLKTGLDNWSVMVARLAREESQRREAQQQAKPGVLSFWSSAKGHDAKEAEGRWDAEGAVIRERTKRTSDLVENLKPVNKGIFTYLKA